MLLFCIHAAVLKPGGIQMCAPGCALCQQASRPLSFVNTFRTAYSFLLLTCEGSNIPRNIVAPANGLNPVNSACVKPHQVPRTLDETINRHVGLVQVLQVGPPGSHQEVNVVPVRGGQTKTYVSVSTLGTETGKETINSSFS